MKQNTESVENAALQEPTLGVVVIKLTAEQRETMATMAAKRAATVMSSEEWQSLRKQRADPFQADAEMCFGDPRDFKGGAR